MREPSRQARQQPVLTPALVSQLNDKLTQAVAYGYATVEIIVEKGEVRWIRGPAPSEPARIS